MRIYMMEGKISAKDVLGVTSEQTIIQLDVYKVIEQLGLDPSKALEALWGVPAEEKKAVPRGA